MCLQSGMGPWIVKCLQYNHLHLNVHNYGRFRDSFGPMETSLKNGVEQIQGLQNNISWSLAGKLFHACQWLSEKKKLLMMKLTDSIQRGINQHNIHTSADSHLCCKSS